MALQFEWDDEKERSNVEKHGVDFDTALKVFFDPNRVEYYDKSHSTDEDRFITIGFAGKLLFVVYTERKENIRLISARIATNSERRRYYDRKTQH